MRIQVKTRDLGNGSEQFTVEGRFIGERDTWGKDTFVANTGTRYYLFDDEWRLARPGKRAKRFLSIEEYFNFGSGHGWMTYDDDLSSLKEAYARLKYVRAINPNLVFRLIETIDI